MTGNNWQPIQRESYEKTNTNVLLIILSSTCQNISINDILQYIFFLNIAFSCFPPIQCKNLKLDSFTGKDVWQD